MRFLNSKGILTALEFSCQPFRQEICTMLGCKSQFPFSSQTFYVHEFSLKLFSFSFLKNKLEILFFPLIIQLRVLIKVKILFILMILALFSAYYHMKTRSAQVAILHSFEVFNKTCMFCKLQVLECNFKCCVALYNTDIAF